MAIFKTGNGESGNQGIINFWTFCGIKQAIKTFFGKSCNEPSKYNTQRVQILLNFNLFPLTSHIYNPVGYNYIVADAACKI